VAIRGVIRSTSQKRCFRGAEGKKEMVWGDIPCVPGGWALPELFQARPVEIKPIPPEMQEPRGQVKCSIGARMVRQRADGLK